MTKEQLSTEAVVEDAEPAREAYDATRSVGGLFFRELPEGDQSHLARMAARLASPINSAWQPIESAPAERDDYSYSLPFIAWHEGYGVFPCKQRGGKYFDLEIVDRDGDWESAWPSPTHWMPLPTPPEQDRSKGREA